MFAYDLVANREVVKRTWPSLVSVLRRAGSAFCPNLGPSGSGSHNNRDDLYCANLTDSIHLLVNIDLVMILICDLSNGFYTRYLTPSTTHADPPS